MAEHEGLLKRPTGRRTFLKASGVGAAVLGLGACEDIFGGDNDGNGGGGTVTLDFSTDFGVLNYAFALEQLEAAFYTMLISDANFLTTFPAGEERRLLGDIRDHEIAHREFLAAAIPALGGQRIPNLTPDFSSIDLRNRTAVLQAARAFEDLGVGAYNGAGKYLQSADLLGFAGKIVSVEARHAAAIRDLLAPKTGEFAPNDRDPALEPEAVLATAGPFIRERIRVRNTMQS